MRCEIEQTMPADELDDWLTFMACEPIGDMREDLRLGILVSNMVNLVGNKTKATDFMMFVDAHDPVELTAQELAAKFHREFGRATAHLGVQIIRNDTTGN